MELGMIGLGRMGANMTERLVRGGHRVVSLRSERGSDPAGRRYRRRRRPLSRRFRQAACAAARYLDDGARPARRSIRPSSNCCPALSKGDILDRRRQLQLQRLHPPRREVVRAGHALRRCRHQRRNLGPGKRLLHDGRRRQRRSSSASRRSSRRLRRPTAMLHVGPSGAGHFVKMIHNGIEYGMMQAYGEGFELLKASQFDLDLAQISRAVEPRQRGALVAAGTGRARLRRRSRAVIDQGLRRGFRRRTLDRRGSDRKERAGAGADALTVRPLRVAPGGFLFGKIRRRAAQRVRRSRGQERLMSDGERSALLCARRFEPIAASRTPVCW